MSQQHRSATMIKTALFIFFISFGSFSLSLPLLKQSLLIAQEEGEEGDDSLFDDSDLADIEGLDPTNEDQELEDEFESFEEESDENFEEGDFEAVEEETEEEDQTSEDEGGGDDFEREDYEEISDRPGYEIISDEELEKEFEEDSVEETAESPAEDPKTADEGKENVLEDRKGEPDEPSAEGVEDDFDLEDDSGAEEDLGFEDPAGTEEDLDIDNDSEAEEGLDDLGEEEGLDFDDDSEEGEDLGEEGDLDLGDDSETREDLSLEAEEFSEEVLNMITNIRYLTEGDRIIIDCSEPASYQVRKNTDTNQYIIEILQARLSENLHWPYVMRDFKTNFGLIKADQKDPSTVRVIIQLKDAAPGFPESTLMENNNQILVAYGRLEGNDIISEGPGPDQAVNPGDILPAKTLEDLYFGDVKFSGTPISFHVIDAPVKQVLRFISEESGLNMVIGENVSGNITLKLEDVPWDQALHTIFKVKSLGYTRDGNVITILPLTEIEERTKKLKEISDRQKSLAPFTTKVIPVSYASLSEITEKIKSFSTKGSDTVEGGKIISHQESGALVVIDTPETIRKMEELVRYLDKSPKQVMVEAKIAEVSKTFTSSFGLRWTMGGTLPVTVNASGLLDLLGGISGSYDLNSGGDVGLTFSGLPIIGDLTANLSLAENEGYAQIISTPKVVVISGEKASITRNAPILVARSENEVVGGGGTGGISTSRSLEKEDISISLDVTPTVTTTGSVFLEVSVDRTEPGPSAGGEGETLKIQRNAKTKVLAKNGQTIVIGGIYEQDTGGGSAGIPILKDIPFLNLLFRQGNRRQSSSELLVFITPRLLDSHE